MKYNIFFQDTKMFLTNITLFGCMICILCNSSSFINVVSASSIRYTDVYPVVKFILSDYNHIVFACC